MNLRQMEAFYAVMRSGSVTEAARMLNISQPAVSMTLRHTETTLKMKLFERSKGRLHPTAEAEALFAEVSEIFRRVDLLKRSVSDLKAGRLGALSIAGAQPLVNGLLTEAVAGFRQSGQNISIFMQALATQQVIDRIVDGEVELGICFGAPAGSSVNSETLVTVELACLLPAGDPLAGPGASHVALGDIADMPIITYRPQADLRGKVNEAFGRANTHPNVGIQINSSITAHKLVSKGVGLAIVEPTYAYFEQDPAVVSKPVLPTARIDIHMLTSSERPLSRVARDFQEILRVKAAILGRALKPA